MRHLINQVILIFIYCVSSSQCRSNGYSLEIQHAFGENEFQKRGEIFFSNLKGEETEIQQNPLSDSDLEFLKESSASNGFYRVRILSSLRSEEKQDWVSSYCFAKDLVDSKLQDILTIHTDGLGSIISVHIQCNADIQYEELLAEFDTSINVVTPSIAPVPDTAGFLTKMEDEQRKKEIQAKEPQSFLGKYWMYILPIVIFMIMSNSSQQ